MNGGRPIAPDAQAKTGNADPAGSATDRDERLAQMLGEMGEHLRRGQHAAIDRLLADNADLADELRPLWAAMLVTDCIAAGARQSAAASNPPSRSRAGALAADATHDHTPAGVPPASPLDGPRNPAFDMRDGSEVAVSAAVLRRFADYELHEELGRGGMGVVYKARQVSLDRIVALKMVLRADMASAADLARFRSEAEAAARLDHPAIVPVYEVGAQDGQPYFTMKYVAGTTLARKLADGPLSARNAAALLAPVARAIHFAHTRGVLHRDLKPSNILIDTEGRPHVSDFGLAKRVEADSNLTLTGAILGTPAHMAPEQAAGSRGKLGPTSDVYSLGTILYQMLTGRPPFQAASPVDTVLLVLEQDPLPPRLVNPRADRELEMIALKCLQKPQDLRYESAKLLADDLDAFLADEPTAARSGIFTQVLSRAFRETHHATVLENWGLLWMWHSLALLVTCLLTNLLQWQGATSALPYLALWTAGLGTWAAIFWTLRRRAGPVTFVERQIAHVWAASMISIVVLFYVEMIMGLPVLALSPVLGLVGGMVFVVKAGTLSGQFYFQAAALFATALGMALLERLKIPLGLTLFGVVSAACFFLPGLKYYWQRRDADLDAASLTADDSIARR
ncbi:MAG TPA: serine/threonine-protein kinase [Pirellulales bacterium]|jgi:serine/threonine-protein kinase